ncbi:nuclease-related domain-containing protein [Paenisporosarcina cavernae]|uniref:nuclease-related domain-containing protein n=1 Tax=Paenisporosarcina cavernae TaxID=2320858 RepID=UPI0013C52E14|nr:nuclease-related domain-containing protein [Paenisporosarcina cavernae]
MNTKKRETSPYYQVIETLSRRLIPTHPSYSLIQRTLAKMDAGNWGEDSVAHLFTYFYPTFPFNILHDVFLKSTTYVQIDHILITPFKLFVIESKNLKGQLIVTRHPDQLVQVLEDGKRIAYDSPLAQSERNAELLNRWLTVQGYNIPVEHFVVFTNPTAEINTMQSEPSIVRTKFLTNEILKRITGKKLLTFTELDVLANKLRSSHISYQKNNILEKYQIRPEHIVKGVQCSNCHRIRMEWKTCKWQCNCGYKSKDSHLQAFEDYRLLFGETITNKLCREFLAIEDRYIAKRLLQLGGYQKSGTKRHTKYSLTSEKNIIQLQKEGIR